MVPPPEAVLPPDPPVGPETGNIGTSYTYIAAGARSTYNHPLEYQIDWKGDGTDITSWGSQELTKVFSSSGTYDIKTRARCAWDTTIESDWSEPLSVTISSSPGIQPIPDIKANGSDGPISVSQRNPLSITISLNSGDRYGQNADWWILVSTSAGPYSYHVGNSWTPGVSTVYQGPLMDLAYAELFNISGLPTGTYTFYFVVDLNMNGNVDMDKVYYDSVDVTITP
jgi:hypothetical protein